MAFQSAHERFLREKIAAAEQRRSEIEQRKGAERDRFAELAREHQVQLDAFSQQSLTAEASLAAYVESLENFLVSRAEPRPQRRKPGRGVSARWSELFAKLPSAPDQGLTVSEFAEIVGNIHPGIQRTAIRSQLSAAKKAGRLENVDRRWRRVAEATTDGERNEASEATTGPTASGWNGGDARSSTHHSLFPPEHGEPS